MSDVELGRKGLLLLALVLLALLATRCAARPPVPPRYWEVCRDACAAQGGTHAAVVGPAKAAERPGCLCAQQSGIPGGGT